MTAELDKWIAKYIGSIKKNQSTEIQVKVDKFKGVKYVHVREYYKNKAGEMCPTKKGVAITCDKVGELVSLVEKAEDEVRVKA